MTRESYTLHIWRFQDQDILGAVPTVGIRTPYFRLSDLCDLLEISEPEEFGIATRTVTIEAEDGKSDVYVPETTLYAMLNRGRSDLTDKLYDWVRDEVIAKLSQTQDVPSTPHITLERNLETTIGFARRGNDRISMLIHHVLVGETETLELDAAQAVEVAGRLLRVLSEVTGITVHSLAVDIRAEAESSVQVYCASLKKVG